ncbi:MAG: hypothetical protein SGPRY_010958 [Prymnesium sp.]
MADYHLTLEELLSCDLTLRLPLTILNLFTWPDPPTRFTHDADPMETGKELKSTLAAHIGYLAVDVLIRRSSGIELDDSESLSSQGLMHGEELRLVHRTKLADHGMLVPSSTALEQLPQSAFALSCVEDFPKKPVLLRMLQLNHGMLPNLGEKSQELDDLLIRLSGVQGNHSNTAAAAPASAPVATGAKNAALCARGAMAPPLSAAGPIASKQGSAETPHSTLAELAGVAWSGKRKEAKNNDDIFKGLLDSLDNRPVVAEPSPCKRKKLPKEARSKPQPFTLMRSLTQGSDRSSVSEISDDRASLTDSSYSEEAVPSGSWLPPELLDLCNLERIFD